VSQGIEALRAHGNFLISILIWVITRIPENFITGRGGRISDNGIIIEVFQIAFVAIVIAIIVFEKRKTSDLNHLES
jgi:hypothetical protein